MLQMRKMLVLFWGVEDWWYVHLFLSQRRRFLVSLFRNQGKDVGIINQNKFTATHLVLADAWSRGVCGNMSNGCNSLKKIFALLLSAFSL
jgi:hypothetical protein